MGADLYAEIVRIRPKPGNEERLLAMRDELVQSYRDNWPGFVSCRLLRPEEGGTWVDLWYWKSKPDAEAALADSSKTPLFDEWVQLVDMVQFEWAEILSDG
jgi:quinol monooxygenase YgiN